MTIAHPTTCSCCGDMLRGMYDRRRFLQAAAVGGAAAMQPSTIAS